MPQLKHWSVTLKIRGPILTQSSAPDSFGVDAPFARNALGRYYLAGSLVKGKLREAWKDLASLTGDTVGGNWRRLLGPDPDENFGVREQGLLHFSDFELNSAASQPATRNAVAYRIKMDPHRGAVEKGMNLMLESPFEPGGVFEFKGRVSGIVDDPNTVRAEVLKGLRYITHFGAEASVGFGRLEGVVIGNVNPITINGNLPAAGGDRIRVAIQPYGPFCASGRRIGNNLFESEPFLSGAVLKGTLAAALAELAGSPAGTSVSNLRPAGFGDLCLNFDSIRILHAFPAAKDSATRPVTPPLSLVRGPDGELRDVATLEDPILLDGAPPAFQTDWKENDEQQRDLDDRFGLTHPVHELRVRTRIDSAVRRAMTGALFAYRLICPKAQVGRETSAWEWLTEIDLSLTAPENRSSVKNQLVRLLNECGFPAVGKTKTFCRVANRDWSNKLSSSLAAVDGEWIVALQTPGLLIDLSTFKGVAAGEAELSKAYQDYWSEASGHKLVLGKKYYAAEFLHGGEYLHHHFEGLQDYLPFLLTAAGSVFVLSTAQGVTAAEAARVLQSWLDHGLPVGKAPGDRLGLAETGPRWPRCPYLPEHGFGEIHVNLPVHRDPALTPQEIPHA